MKQTENRHHVSFKMIDCEYSTGMSNFSRFTACVDTLITPGFLNTLILDKKNTQINHS